MVQFFEQLKLHVCVSVCVCVEVFCKFLLFVLHHSATGDQSERTAFAIHVRPKPRL